MEVGKLPNHMNSVSCDYCFYLFAIIGVCFSQQLVSESGSSLKENNSLRQIESTQDQEVRRHRVRVLDDADRELSLWEKASYSIVEKKARKHGQY